jgi:hypothetical protein
MVTQGISVVENCVGREHIVNHLSIPAACFTHPEVSFVGMTEEQAREKAEKDGFEVAVAKTSFKASATDYCPPQLTCSTSYSFYYLRLHLCVCVCVCVPFFYV